MKKYKLFLGSLLAFGLVFSGCGGGSSDTPPTVQNNTAYFIDSPVSGLAYKSQSKEGTTLSDGAFEYASSDINVTFKAGEITLGTIKVSDINADSKLFIQDLVGVSRESVDNADVLKIASLLQSLDTGANTNGITLDSNDLDNLTESKDIKDINVSRQLALAGKTLKDEDAVKEHLGDTIRLNGIALYNYTPQSNDSNITTLKNIVTNGILNATDKNDNFLEYMIESNTTHGTVELIADSNSFKYTPNAEYVGADSFTYKTYDGEKYSKIATVNIVVEDVVPTSGDTTPPTPPTIVSLDAQKNSLTLFWLNATDETTPTNEIRYEIHLSTDANFTADSSTLKQTVVNTLEADISGLAAETLYYIKIRALDGADNNAISQESSMQTLSQEVVLSSNAVIKKATELHLENAIEESNTLVFKDSEKAEVPNARDILVGNAQDAYLKRVVSVDKNETTTKVKVEDVAITDVVQSAKLSSKVVLFGTSNSGIAQSSSIQRSVSFKTNNTKETRTSWGSGRFSVVDTQALSVSSSPRRSATRSNGDFSVTVVQDNIVVAQNDRVKIDISAKMLQAGLDDDLEFISIEVISFEHPSKSPAYQDIVSTINKHEISAYFSWTPFSADISDEEYTLTYEVCAKDTFDDGVLDGMGNSCETIKSKIKVIAIAETGEAGKTTTTFNSQKEFTNTVTLDFSPTLTVNTDIVDGDIKSAEVSIRGDVDFNVLTTFKYDVAATKKYEFQMAKKTYYSIYALGPLPVYQKVTFTIDAELEATADGSIEAVSDLNTTFSMTAGVTYDGDEWSKIPFDPTLTKDYTATFKAAGGVNVKVRLIPNIEVQFFKVATAGFSVEPWLEGDLRASATATFNTDFVDADAMGIHRIENLQLDVGLEGKVYADLTVWKVNLAHYPSGGGKQTIFNPTLNVFDIPTLALGDNGVDICGDSPYRLNATITNPDSLVRNNFVEQNIKWIVFPSAGASITPNLSNIKEATFEFTKQDNYTIYMVGNSEKLGSVAGKQYETFNINTNGCTIVVPDTTAPIFANGSSSTADVNENQTTAITLNASDETSTVMYSISGADSDFFNINSTTGEVTFKVAPDYEAIPTKTSYLFVATARDAAGNSATQNITINILDVNEIVPNEIPTATAQSITVEQDSTNNTIILSGQDVDDDALTYIIVTQVLHGTLTVNGKNLLYSPTSGYSGSDSLVFKTNDGKVDSLDATVNITITPVEVGTTNGTIVSLTSLSDWIVYGSATLKGTQLIFGDSVGYDTSDSDGDLNPYNIWFEGGTTTNNGVDYDVVVSRGNLNSSFSVEWEGCFPETTAGGNVFAIGKRNLLFTAEENSKEYPVTSEIAFSTTWDRSGLRVMRNNNYDDSVIVTSASLSNNHYCGKFKLAYVDGLMSAYFNDVKIMDKTYQDDGSELAIHFRSFENEFTIDSINVDNNYSYSNTLPTTQDKNITVEQESTNNTITLTGSDADGDTLSYSVVTQPLNGTLSGTVPNLTYTPSTNYSGADSFTYKVNDGTDDSAVATINITINATQTPLSVTSTIKKTGQTKSYNASGAEVTDGSIKDDGYYQKGQTPNYTRASDIVTDELTGLMWQDDATPSSMTWDAAGSYCADKVLGGYTDWRLPTRKELVGLSDYGRYYPAIDPTFINTISDYYWSSTTHASYASYAWIVSFYNGSQGNDTKTLSYYVRCVRAGQ